MSAPTSLPDEYLAAVAGLPDMALLYDTSSTLLHANPAGHEGLTALGLLEPGAPLSSLDLAGAVVPADRQALRSAMRTAAAGMATPSVRLELQEASTGPTGAVLFNPLTLRGRRYVQVLVRHVTARTEGERAVTLSQARLRAVFDHSPVGVAVIEDRRFSIVNPAMCELLGRAAEELVGMSADDLTHPEDRALNDIVVSGVRRGEVVRVVKRYVRPDGSVLHAELVAVRVRVDGTIHTVVHLRDLTRELAATADLERAAMHDALTGLGNRLLVQDRLEHALARRAEHRSSLAVLFVDLDGFKQVNDALSHAVGDRVLEAVARRLRDAVRPGDSLGRWGGDEFVLVLEDLRDDREAMVVVDRVQQALAQPLHHDDETFVITASIGVAYAAADEQVTSTQLITGADAAMYRAKAHGRNRHAVFDQALRDSASRRAHVEAVLRSAIDRDRIVMHYQPLIDLESRRIIGAEALLRLRDDDGTLLQPHAFLQVAEDSGFMLRLERAILVAACEQAARWSAAGHDLSVSVNLCAAQLAKVEDLEAAVGKALAITGLPPERLVCEVTEHALLDTGSSTLAGMHRLCALGVEFAVDDFGTGYSSMAYLQQLPVSEVKIDRRFVVQAGKDRRAAAIVRAVAGIATELDMRCVAEGIEDEATHDLARRLGATRGQGFLYARPMPAEAFVEYLTS